MPVHSATFAALSSSNWPLGGEGHGLALQRITGHFAGQFHVFELVALQGALDAQLAIEFGAHPQHRLVGAEERGEL